RSWRSIARSNLPPTSLHLRFPPAATNLARDAIDPLERNRQRLRGWPRVRPSTGVDEQQKALEGISFKGLFNAIGTASYTE
ncbi:hypothetical protein, partial [Mesorhizobium intechi]|uniref:hypothetical protein n=1 Tax=Mesorhizobium intechi TaxID=537601 RepID=UPI001ABFA0CF